MQEKRNENKKVKIIGSSKAIRNVVEQALRISKFDSSVLLTGESGVGKGAIAKYIHHNSPRHNKPFITLICAAMPESTLEDEIFGHEKGAFTGANDMRKGKFEEANGGTLFLDEIGDMPLTIQGKLLRVLEPVHDLFNINTAKASTVIWRLVFNSRSQFFHSRLHFSSHAKDLSTTHLFGITLIV